MGDRADAVEQWLVRAFAGQSSPEEARRFLAPHVVEVHDVQTILDGFAASVGDRPLLAVRRGPIPSIVTLTYGGTPSSIECVLDEEDRVLGIQPVPDGLHIEVSTSAALTATQRDELHRLFDVAYDQADGDYLDRSLTKLGWVSMATSADGELVGFSLGDLRELDLPIVGPTPALLAGLGCVDPRHRRQGLFRYLSNLALRAAGILPRDRLAVGAGRMAHPASMRTMAAAPTVVPKPGRRPTPLQQAVGQAVADSYGVASFDPETFVCRGSGKPIGFPRMRQEVEPHEWEVFEPVDRTRGDSLLAIIWHGDAPEGW